MIVYLNGEYIPAEEATISPFDRGFLFGDGIYDALPSYNGKLVGMQLHLDRMTNGLENIGIENPLSDDQWREIAARLISEQDSPNVGVYFHVTRGNEGRRFHGFPIGIKPTVLAMAAAIPPPPTPERDKQDGLKVSSSQDLRWQRCNIKSTALLGNVLHFQESYASDLDETILYNAAGELTEASACNVFIVKDGVVATPPLDHQILPGISRHIAIEAMRAEGSIPVEERVISMDEVRQADEVWVSSSSKLITPVIELDGKPVGDGMVGPVWEKAIKLYLAAMYDYP
ncbi:D-alanine aminotransferase [Seongchinamella unica]|uniref:Aminodeoxychorismate lyase n=1 Tax=Seongchinamella unica TaxID=2547392 RepID=A0A4R5LP46_9GAMM|nr:D-amino acid aminotransferase [Seongchinamella unica]TDG12152.1 D-alanine aminotransferase [Seongchinamella unica]